MPFYDFIVYFGGYFINVARVPLPRVRKGIPGIPTVPEAWDLAGNTPKWVGAWVGTWVLFRYSYSPKQPLHIQVSYGYSWLGA
jgi:hypothetical protein